VREHGIPLETFRVTGSDGRKIAAYRFGDVSQKRFRKLSGRTGLSKKIKEFLIEKYGCKCFIYLEDMDESELQIDHRIPFAMRQVRRADLIWQGKEVEQYEQLKSDAKKSGRTIPEFVKQIIEKAIKRSSTKQ
jgi:predicted DNA-binding protein